MINKKSHLFNFLFDIVKNMVYIETILKQLMKGFHNGQDS